MRPTGFACSEQPVEGGCAKSAELEAGVKEGANRSGRDPGRFMHKA